MSDETQKQNEADERQGEASKLSAVLSAAFLGTEDLEFRAFVKAMPDKHWAKYDLSAVRLGWEAHKLLGV